MSTSWICRPYRPGDETGILDLYRQVFHFDLTPDFWRWMYQASPSGPAAIVVAETDRKMVGHYAIQLRDFWCGPQRSTVGIAVGAMLVPQARNVATFVEMVQLACELARRRGLRLIYAFPNDVSDRVHRALLSWRSLPQIVEWDGPLPMADQQTGGKVQVWRDMPPQLEFDTIDAAVKHQTVCSSRSTAWLRWRFFERPGGEYVLHTIADGPHVTSYAVTKRYQREGVRYGHILDWRTMPTAAHRSSELLASVWRELAQWNVERISTWARGQDDLAANLSAAGLSATGRKTNFCWFDLAGNDAGQLPPESAWQVDMADSDIY